MLEFEAVIPGCQIIDTSNTDRGCFTGHLTSITFAQEGILSSTSGDWPCLVIWANDETLQDAAFAGLSGEQASNDLPIDAYDGTTVWIPTIGYRICRM